MIEHRIPVTRQDCTVDGNPCPEWCWKELDFSKAEFRTQATSMVALVGKGAPIDLHLRVPKPAEGTFHRVRMRQDSYHDLPLKGFERSGDGWEAVYSK